MTDYAEHLWAFLDRWPARWHALSFATEFRELSYRELLAVLALGDCPDGRIDEASALAADLDFRLAGTPRFIRLNTRSPKDIASPGLPITSSGQQALYWLAHSRRTRIDMRLLLDAGLPCLIALREVYPLAEPYEFRAFVRQGKLHAISQYYRCPGGVGPWRERHFLERLSHSVRAFIDREILPFAAAESFVVDLYCPAGHPERLIEINPYEGADGGCVSIEQIEAEGGVFVS